MHRRRFLQGMGSGLGASMFSWSGLMTPKVFAEIAKQQQKRWHQPNKEITQLHDTRILKENAIDHQ